MKFLNLGGVMIWTMDMDDFGDNFCQKVLNQFRKIFFEFFLKGKYPLINFIKTELMNGDVLTTTSQTSITTASTSRPVDQRCMNGPGYYADKQSQCRKFYLCAASNGKFNIFEFECPNGLLFDEKILACNYQSQVMCNI